MKQIYPDCKNERIIKYGLRYNKKGKTQIYFCEACSKRFTPKDGFRCMKYDKKTITLALDCYAKGMSLRGIKHHLKMFYNIKISHVGILYWVQRYGKLIKEYTDKLKPKLSEKWYADETVLLFNKRKNWLWNIMDSKSRFWITGNVSLFRHQKDAEHTFNMAKETVGNKPKQIATDGSHHYCFAPKKAFPKIKHVRYIRPEQKEEMQIMERLQRNIKQRTKVMGGMYCVRTCRMLMDMFQIYYNFVRPHMSLHNRTPAAVAGINLELNGNKWEDLIKISSLNNLDRV